MFSVSAFERKPLNFFLLKNHPIRNPKVKISRSTQKINYFESLVSGKKLIPCL